MTTIKNIFNKLHKADKLELANEKIELSLAKDIQSELKKLQSEESRMSMFGSQIDEAEEELEKAKNFMFETSEDARDFTEKLEKQLMSTWDTLSAADDMAEELGVPPSDIPFLADLNQLFEELGSKLEALNDQIEGIER